MKVKTAAMALLALVSGAVWADTADVGIIDETGFTWSKTGPVVPGEWTSQADAALAMAKDEGIPLIVFFAKRTCGNCKSLEKKFVEEKTVAWFKNRKFILLCGISGEPNTSKVTALCLKGTTLPFVGLYWDCDGDGKSDGKDGGVNNKEVRRGGNWCKSSQEFINWVESYFKGYSAYDGGVFAAPDEEGNRLECEPGTKSVPVVLVREGASLPAAKNTLDISYPNKAKKSIKIDWAEGQAAVTNLVDVAVETAGFKTDGDQVEMIVSDENGVSHATNHITFVDRENSSSNPYWLTERLDPRANGIVPPLQFGEWTMDIDAAKHLAEDQNGWVLVSVQGSMWCPDCANTDRNFLDLEDSGVNKVQKWAKEKKVALVALDIPNFTGPAATDFSSPCLLSRKVATSTLARPKEYPQSGADAGLLQPMNRSGLGYQTRKGISEADATAQLEKFHDYASLNTDQGGFHRPEDGNKNRTGVPILVLLRKDGSVAARFTRFASVSPMLSDRQYFDNYIARIEEMMAIGAASGSHADASEIENNYAGDGSVSIIANGGKATNELSHADQRDTFKLTDFTGNSEITVAVRGDSNLTAKLSLWRRANGVTSAVSGAESSAKLSAGVKVEYTVDEPGEYFVQVEAVSVATKSDPGAEQPEIASTKTGETFIAYELTSKVSRLNPTASAATASAPADTNVVTMALEKDVTYRLVGLDPAAEGNLAVLTAVTGSDGYLFTAKATGAAELFCLTDGGSVTYQKWERGKVGFAPQAATLPEKKTTEQSTVITRKENEDVTIAYRRIDGVSGDVKVKVSLDVASTDFFYDYSPDIGMLSKDYPRFRINGKTASTWSEVVDWKDGTPLADCVSNILVTASEYEDYDVSKWFGPGKVAFKFEILGQTEAGVFTNVIDNASFVINFTETSKQNAGKAAVLGADREWAKKLTVYARESEEVEVTIGRIEAFNGAVFATLQKSVASVVLGGDYGLLTGFSWANRDSGTRLLTVTNLPPAGKSVKLTLKSATTGFGVLSASNAVTIVSVTDDAPAFKETSAAATLYRYVAMSNIYEVVGTQGGNLSFTKLSGSLPSGLKAVWDKGANALAITGVPTGNDKAGKRYTAVYQVTEKRPKTPGSKSTVSVPGLTIELNYTVIDPAYAGSGEGGKALNDSCAKSRTFKDLMVVTEGEGAGKYELFGTLQITLPATGKASAKFLCPTGTVSFSAKSWSRLDLGAEGNPLHVRLAGTGKFKDWELEVVANRDGSIEAGILVDSYVFLSVGHSGKFWSKTYSAADCKGYYTVTFEKVDDRGAGAEASPTGCGYVALTMTSSSQWNAGTMKWAGVLPNGTSVSGSAVLAEVDEDTVVLPLVKMTTKDKFASALRIVRRASEKSGKECWETVDAPEAGVALGDEVLTKWTHLENKKDVQKGDFEIRYRPYGGIYDISKNGLDCCCEDKEEGRGTKKMTLSAELPSFISDYYGLFGEVESIDLTVGEKTISRNDSRGGKNKITLSFNNKTGLVSGSFDIHYVNASGDDKTLKATYKGLVQLGFGDGCGCGLGTDKPFVNGFWYVSDKLGYQWDELKSTYKKWLSVKRGGALTVVPVSEDK